MIRWDSVQPVAGYDRIFERAVAARTSRGEFLRRGAAAAGAVAGVGLLGAGPALGRSGAAPKPIPGGLDASFTPVPSDPFIHVVFPAVGFEMSTITDFNGVLAAAEIRGTARGSDGTSYTFDADMRFMRGAYIAANGSLREGAFGFV
jgi:hypothetical protein